MFTKLLLSAAYVFAIVLSVPASAASFQPKGYIQNHSGTKCWYTQRTEAESTYFHGTLKGAMSTVTFADAKCMSEGLGGQDVNIMMINNIIARWYYGSQVQSDAAFQTRADELLPTSMFQKKGRCMQSKTYPSIGVTVDYEISNGAIVRVRHGNAVQGCKR